MLLCLTANHRNASFDLLEKLSLAAPDAVAGLVDATDEVRGAVVLATCNRFEAYLEIAEGGDTAATDAVVDVMSRASSLSSSELRGAITVLSRDEVVTHLFAVTSGLESVVVGEDEIAGQVGRALQRARVDGTTSGDLEQLFQRATQTSRGVKTRTSVGGAGRSLVRLALELASSRVPDWSLARVLIVGTGQYAATTVAALRDHGATMLSVFSPSGRADAFGTKYGVTVQRDLAGAMLDADVIITCTSATVIGTSAIIGAERRLVIDLGMPRNVDPAIVSLPGIELLDLETISLHAPVEELTATADARELVSDAAARYSAERSIEPAIVALRAHIFELLDREIERANKRGAGPETEAALRHLASVLLHTPSVLGREAALDGRGQEFVDGLEAVFGVTGALAVEDPRSGAASA
ncbi:MAG: glutamyl-tRNA reductase [Actinomycetota bacterium]|nr:glutamyl-tRNA reductase [Actinomycetota bacterium]